ncbi:MAG: rRNA (adenine2503-C2)-methyltransferase [Patescibacteria group bacterium]|nr:rRNA (adenine2503-C2)-methyltransferase [Patescibacteria group bacterium]
MNLEKLSATLEKEPKYRYQQVNKFLFQDYISSWQEASSLPQVLREKLAKECPLEIKSEVKINLKQKGNQKALISLADGALIETVLISQKSGKKENKEARYTVCVSTQVGCPMACTFCASGLKGFTRNLSFGEMIEQVVFWNRALKGIGKVDNVVFMGMGEPFLNYQEFIKAVKFMNNPETMNIGARRLSVSTAGIISGIKRLAGEKIQINLAISLHAPTDSLRQKLMPVAGKNKIEDILRAVDNYIKKTGRRVMFEYVLIKAENDSEQNALTLAKLMAKPLYLVNLIPYNETGRYRASQPETIKKFKEILESKGVATTVRLSFGAEIEAACGQLKNRRAHK